MRETYLVILTQIITESFPVSSSGHLAILSSFFNMVQLSEDVLFFLHLPTLAVLAYFFVDTWWPLLYSIRRTYVHSARMSLLAGIATGITLLFYGLFKMIGTEHIPFGLGFGITAVLLWSLRYAPHGNYQQVTLRHVLILGVVQGCALLPGISRFASTFVAGRWLQLSPHKAFKVSFMLQTPLLVAACAKALLVDQVQSFFTWDVMMVMSVGSIIAYYGLRFNYYLAISHKLWWYSLYLLSLFMLWLLLG